MPIADRWQQFLVNCHTITNLPDLNQFFELTLTPAEREKIALRYSILSELINGNKTQREIAASLGVSVFNVTRGANQLKRVEVKAKSLIACPPEN